jgi:hypothetical protein
MFKPVTDTRYSDTDIMSRDDLRMKSDEADFMVPPAR